LSSTILLLTQRGNNRSLKNRLWFLPGKQRISVNTIIQLVANKQFILVCSCSVLLYHPIACWYQYYTMLTWIVLGTLRVGIYTLWTRFACIENQFRWMSIIVGKKSVGKCFADVWQEHYIDFVLYDFVYCSR